MQVVALLLQCAADAEASARTRLGLADALQAGFASDRRAVTASKVSTLACSLETALQDVQRGRSRRYRQLLYNLKDAKNPDLRNALVLYPLPDYSSHDESSSAPCQQ